MKLLLDENITGLLKADLPEHQVSTVADQGWRGIKNGNLLQLMIASNFEALITFDRRLPYQQNFKRYPIPVVILRAPKNEYEILRNLAPQLNALLRRRLKPGPHELILTAN